MRGKEELPRGVDFGPSSLFTESKIDSDSDGEGESPQECESCQDCESCPPRHWTSPGAEIPIKNKERKPTPVKRKLNRPKTSR